MTKSWLTRLTAPSLWLCGALFLCGTGWAACCGQSCGQQCEKPCNHHWWQGDPAHCVSQWAPDIAAGGCLSTCSYTDPSGREFAYENGPNTGFCFKCSACEPCQGVNYDPCARCTSGGSQMMTASYTVDSAMPMATPASYGDSTMDSNRSSQGAMDSGAGAPILEEQSEETPQPAQDQSMNMSAQQIQDRLAMIEKNRVLFPERAAQLDAEAAQLRLQLQQAQAVAAPEPQPLNVSVAPEPQPSNITVKDRSNMENPQEGLPTCSGKPFEGY